MRSVRNGDQRCGIDAEEVRLEVWFIIVDCNLAQVTENMLLYMLIALIPPSVHGYPHYLESQYQACSPWIYIPKFNKCYKKFCADRYYNDHKHLCKRLGALQVNICSLEENHIVASKFPRSVLNVSALLLLHINLSTSDFSEKAIGSLFP
ncbi:unnamed protein product [Haemonchus placei]|uniref:Uncharacterized protein n=1 Tax=Haemonchus placei TaxID=6290 RepID=A0A3P7ZRZ0_HAEPC|nr:unnamed protein product [Haemonchus placei]